MPPRAHAQTHPMPSLEDIARFYSGGNMRGNVTFDWTNTLGTTGGAGSGNIRLNPQLKAGFAMLRKYGPRSQQGMVGGALALSTLIHEALHNRVQPGWDNANEVQMLDLGPRLLPDAMQRFFGVPMQSAWGQKYRDMVLKQLRPPGR
jgi:hypothetical protein